VQGMYSRFMGMEHFCNGTDGGEKLKLVKATPVPMFCIPTCGIWRNYMAVRYHFKVVLLKHLLMLFSI